MSFGVMTLSLISALFGMLVSITPANEFHFNNHAEPESLDPQRSSAQDVSQHIISLYEGLITRDANYQGLKPGIASSWVVSKKGKVITFTLRPNLKWSNGDALTLEQVRNSFLRALDPKTACPYLNNYTDFVEGAAEYSAAGSDASKRAAAEKNLGIRAIGKNQLEFTLKFAAPIFLEYLTAKAFMPVHPSMMDPDSPAWRDPAKYISNGPFKLTEWKVNDRVVMEKNPFYYDASQVKIQKLVAYAINDFQACYNMYESGQIDWTGDNSVSPALVPALQGRKDFSFKVSLGTYMYLFNVTKPPLDKFEVRRALSLVLNRAEITDKVLKDGKIPTTRLIPPSVTGYHSIMDDSIPSFEERVKEAKALMAKAGYPDGKGFPKTVLRYNTNESHKAIAQMARSMWKKQLGIDVEIENMEWKVYLGEQQNHQFQIARQAWVTDLADPSEWLSVFRTGDPSNYNQYSNPQFDATYNLAIREMNEKKRNDLYAKAEKIVLDEQAIAPIYHYVYYGLISPRVKGVEANAAGLHLFRYLSKK